MLYLYVKSFREFRMGYGSALAWILAIIILAIVHAGAFHFNPVMGLLYHFYSVKDDNGVSNLLISRKPLSKVGVDVETVRVAHNIYLARS